MTRRTILSALLLTAAAATCAACGPSFTAVKPDGFVELDNDDDDYDFRATTAEGLVMSVREIDNDAEGEASFWLTAIKNKMRERGGYALLEEVPVESADQIKGTQLRFGHDEQANKPHLYYLTIFVTPDTIWLVEAGGTKELMTKNAAKIAKAIADFKTN